MYLKYSGLEETPFPIAPEPCYRSMSRRHQAVLAPLLCGIKSVGLALPDAHARSRRPGYCLPGAVVRLQESMHANRSSQLLTPERQSDTAVALPQAFNNALYSVSQAVCVNCARRDSGASGKRWAHAFWYISGAAATLTPPVPASFELFEHAANTAAHEIRTQRATNFMTISTSVKLHRTEYAAGRKSRPGRAPAH